MLHAKRFRPASFLKAGQPRSAALSRWGFVVVVVVKGDCGAEGGEKRGGERGEEW